jgi:hypothetical protein
MILSLTGALTALFRALLVFAIVLLIAVILAIALFIYNTVENETELVAGYSYINLGGYHAIADPNEHPVVESNVIRCKIVDPYIVGERVYHDELSSPNYGYFILDTRNGQLLEGLKEAQFQTALGVRKLNLSAGENCSWRSGF